MRTPGRALVLLLVASGMAWRALSLCAQLGESPTSSQNNSRAQQRRDEREILHSVITHLLTSDRLQSTRGQYSDGDRKLALLSSKTPVPWPFDEPPQVEGWEIRFEKDSADTKERPMMLEVQG